MFGLCGPTYGGSCGCVMGMRPLWPESVCVRAGSSQCLGCWKGRSYMVTVFSGRCPLSDSVAMGKGTLSLGAKGLCSDLGLMGCRLCGTLVPPRTEVVDAAEFYAELCGNLQPFLECAARCGMPRALYVALKVARAATGVAVRQGRPGGRGLWVGWGCGPGRKRAL